MKKPLISIFLIAFTLTLSMPAYCDDIEDADPVGGTVYPVIEATSLDDFAQKLKKGVTITYDNVLAANVTPEEMTKRANERIKKGADYLYIPDVDCEVASIRAYVESVHIFPDNWLYRHTSKYDVAVTSDSEVALDIRSTVKYEDTEISMYYDTMGFSAEYLCSRGYYKKMLLNNVVLYYDIGFGNTEIMIVINDEPYRIVIRKELTEDEIRQLPRGIFYPKALTVADIMKGDYSGSYLSSIDDLYIEVDDPLESDNAESVDVDKTDD